MEDDGERLVVLLEARIKDLERNMAKASGTTGRRFNEMKRHSKSATQQMEEDAIRSTTRINQAFARVSTRIGDYSKAFAGGLIGGMIGGGVAGIVSQIQQVARGVAEIGDQAKVAGLSLRVFQEWKYVAEQNRIPVDALTDAMKELSLRADEFVTTGGGSAAEAFGRLGYSAEDLKEKLKNPSDLMLEIIGRLGQLDRAAQIRIFDELAGGTGGERMVQLIEQGEKGIRDTIRASHDLGAVMSDEVVKKADELDRKFAQVTTTVGTGLKTAIVEAADAMQAFVDVFHRWNNEYERRKNAVDAGAAVGAMFGAEADPNRVRTTRKTGRLQPPPAVIPSQDELSAKYLANYRAELTLTNRERSIAAEAERILSEASSKGLRVTKEQAQALALEKVVRDEGEASAKKLASQHEKSGKQAEAEATKIKELIADLEEELRIVNLSDAAKRASIASRQAGAAATDTERQKIIALNEAIFQEEEARRKADEGMLYYRELTRSGLDDLFNSLEQGKTFWEAMGDVAVNSLKRISQSMLDDVLDSIFKVNSAASGGGGGGFLSSLLGGLFGGTGGFAKLPAIGPVPSPRPFAKGGAFLPGLNGFSNQIVRTPTVFAFASGAGLMGEAGPEAVMPLTRDGSGRLGVSAQGMDGQSGGPQSVHVTSDVKVSVDESGNLQAYVAKTSQAQAQKAINSFSKSQDFTTLVGRAASKARWSMNIK